MTNDECEIQNKIEYSLGNCFALCISQFPASIGHLHRGWDIRNFITARGLGICVPRGNLRAFDTRVFESAIDEVSGKDEAFVEQ